MKCLSSNVHNVVSLKSYDRGKSIYIHSKVIRLQRQDFTAWWIFLLLKKFFEGGENACKMFHCFTLVMYGRNGKVCRHDWLLLQQDLDLVNPQLVQFFQWNNTVFLQVLLTNEINFPVNAIILDKRTFFVDPE